MPPRKELCRNFQRGSCQYGDRCKFLHASPQQSKSNPFGFGMQSGSPFQRTSQQQQMPNPFGFGVQSSTRGGNELGSKPNQFKPFENKWTRFSPLNASGVPASRQSDNQPQAANHKCTDPESCKRIIVEDLENEKPIWKLTCYGHNRYAPCDIVGDVSCEELRGLAYDDAKHGKSLQFIIDRERSLLNSKLVEFQNLLQKPYVVPSVATPSTENQNPFGGGSSNAPIINSGVPSAASSFSQLNASLNSRSVAVPNYNFGQSGAFQNNIQAPNMFQMNSLPFNGSGAFASQPSQQPVQNPFSFGSAGSRNSTISAQQNPFSTLTNSSQTGNMFDKSLDLVFNGTNSASGATEHTSISTPVIIPKDNSNVDDEIWTKAEWKWNVGEIPEDAPPDIYIH